VSGRRVQFGIHVGRGDHLREIDDGDLLVVGYEEVELVEVAVNQSVAGQQYDQLHQPVVHLARVSQLRYLRPARPSVQATSPCS
jgi:hypothetical protein